MLLWLVTAAVLVAVIVAAVGGPGPLDDPNPGQQRTGLLFDSGEAPVVDDLRVPGRPLGQRPVFLLFDRRGHDPARVATVLAEVPARFAFIVVVPRDRTRAQHSGRVRIVADPRRRFADAVDLSQPASGAFPTGYALVDSERRARHATLDPSYGEHAFEVDIVTAPIR